MLFSQLQGYPPGAYQDPQVTNFEKIELFMNSSFYFLSLLVLFLPNFQGKITCFCIYFSFVLSDNMYLVFLLL